MKTLIISYKQIHLFLFHFTKKDLSCLDKNTHLNYFNFTTKPTYFYISNQSLICITNKPCYVNFIINSPPYLIQTNPLIYFVYMFYT